MSSLFRRLPVMDLFKKVAKMAGISGSKKSAAPAAAAAAAAPAEKPAESLATVQTKEETKRRAGRRRARRTGGMRLLMSQGGQSSGGDNKQTKLGPGQ
ncbi:hypothetical protein N9Y91_06805 [Alphaproteobacteria bacterium]|nr:hypothetical protein [Alphaproteobacteria bacterium]